MPTNRFDEKNSAEYTIIIEGPDGVGKTVTGTKLAEALDARYLSHPLPPLKKQNDEERMKMDKGALFLYYLTSNVLAATRGGRKVVDRSFPTTYLGTAILDPEGKEYYQKVVSQTAERVPAPDLQIILVADEDEVRRRCSGRESHSAFDKLIHENFQEYVDQMVRFSKEIYPRVEVLDTTDLSIEETVKKAVELVDEYVEY